MPRDADGLTAKQARFVGEYLAADDPDPASVYLAAGYKARTRYVAQVCASQLLKLPKIAARIANARQKQQDRVQIKADDVLRRLCEIADLDLADVIAEDGTLLDVHGMQEKVRKSLAGIETEERTFGEGESAVSTRTHKVRLADRLRALELIGKHLGMFVERIGNADGSNLFGAVIYLPRGGGSVTALAEGDGEAIEAGEVRELGPGETVESGCNVQTA